MRSKSKSNISEEEIMRMTRKSVMILCLVLLLLVFFACAPGNAKFEAKPAGFWVGLWHGLICWITFIIGLFTDSVRMYEPLNTGNWYDFGFFIGVGGFSASLFASKKKK